MRAISYSALREQVYSLLNLVSADVTPADKTKINSFLQRRTREAFQFAWWPETMREEERFFRAAYAAGTAYTVTQEVYHPASRGYYQALQSTTGNAPATLSGTSYTTNLSYWAPVAESYSGADWADATAYAQGDTVRNPADGDWYRCHTAHTSSGSLDATKFGLLTEWTASIAWDATGETEIGLVRGAYLDRPSRVRSPRRLTVHLGELGVYLPENKVTSVILSFQIRPPVLTGADFSAGTTYTAGTVVYYTSATAGYEGDYWKCLAATSAGQDPEDTPAKWARQEIPEALRDAIAHAAYSDFLRPAGDDGAVPIESTAGGAFLAAEAMKLRGMQRQAGRWSQG